jgi:mRNA interferase RelE/StbE
MWTIKFTESAAKELSKCPKNIQHALKRAILERLSSDPNKFKNLQGEWKGYKRLRVANYRIIYETKEKEIVVLIVKIDVRGKVYRYNRG